jgi:prevent-host-death family protein
MVDLSMGQARMRLGALVRRASTRRERVTITDHGKPAAVLVNAEELADLEEALALAEYRARQASGDQVLIPHDEARKRLRDLAVDHPETGAPLA